MLTISKVIEKAKKIANEYSIQGEIISEDNLNNNDIFDYRVSDFINTALAKIFREYLTVKTTSITLFHYKSLFKPEITFQHLNEDVEIELGKEIKSISFEVLGDNATIILKKKKDDIEEIIEEINIYDSKIIKRKIDELVADEELIMVLSGKYPYLIKRLGVYTIEFETETYIPVNSNDIELKLPNDILRINSIKLISNDGVISEFSDYMISGDSIFINKKYSGELQLIYYKLPQQIPTDNNNLNLFIDCPQACEDCLIYYVASDCMKNYDNQLSILLYNEAELRLSQLSKYTNNNNITRKIADVRGW